MPVSQLICRIKIYLISNFQHHYPTIFAIAITIILLLATKTQKFSFLSIISYITSFRIDMSNKTQQKLPFNKNIEQATGH